MRLSQQRCHAVSLSLSVLLLVVAPFASAEVPGSDQAQRTGRYTAILVGPSAVELDPLQNVVNVEFPDAVWTVGDAVEHLLAGSGYGLLRAPELTDIYQPMLLNKPLPDVHRALSAMTLEQALVTVAGTPWRLVVDRLQRHVAFEVVQPWPMTTVFDTQEAYYVQ